MKYVRFASTLLPLAGAVLVFVAVTAWQTDSTKNTKKENRYQNNSDTTIPKPADINQIDIQLNLDSLMQQVTIALSNIDYDKMNADVQKAMAQINYSKMNLGVNKAMKQIDWKQMNKDVSKAMDSAKMAVNSINWNNVKANISRAQINARKAMAAQKTDPAALQKQVQKSLQDAQINLQKAQIEFKSYKGLISSLEKDGLIEKDKAYHVQLKDGALYLNGVKQSNAITDKYNQYYQNKKNFEIADDGGTDL